MVLRSYFLFLLIILFSGTASLSFSQQNNAALQRLTENADVIVTGNVSGQVSNWNANKSKIFTEATLKVDEYLKGNNSGSSIVITYPGGEVGGVGELYTHMPRFANNEDVIVFLKKDEKGYKVFEGEDGKITIIKDAKTGEKMTTSNIQLKEMKTQIKKYLDK